MLYTLLTTAILYAGSASLIFARGLQKCTPSAVYYVARWNAALGLASHNSINIGPFDIGVLIASCAAICALARLYASQVTRHNEVNSLAVYGEFFVAYLCTHLSLAVFTRGVAQTDNILLLVCHSLLLALLLVVRQQVTPQFAVWLPTATLAIVPSAYYAGLAQSDTQTPAFVTFLAVYTFSATTAFFVVQALPVSRSAFAQHCILTFMTLPIFCAYAGGLYTLPDAGGIQVPRGIEWWLPAIISFVLLVCIFFLVHFFI